jgi:hypothetical protein
MFIFLGQSERVLPERTMNCKTPCSFHAIHVHIGVSRFDHLPRPGMQHSDGVSDHMRAPSSSCTLHAANPADALPSANPPTVSQPRKQRARATPLPPFYGRRAVVCPSALFFSVSCRRDAPCAPCCSRRN